MAAAEVADIPAEAVVIPAEAEVGILAAARRISALVPRPRISQPLTWRIFPGRHFMRTPPGSLTLIA
jgi:hypothetical protein